jgi:hypothetical protein
MNAMREYGLRTGLFLAATMIMLMPSDSARAEMWCIRDFGSDNICVFATARDCTSAAVIRGGICEREPLGRTEASSDRKPAKRVR